VAWKEMYPAQSTDQVDAPSTQDAQLPRKDAR
jgi:hypothetical protein